MVSFVAGQMDFMWNLFSRVTLSDGNLEIFPRVIEMQSVLLSACEQGTVLGWWVYEAQLASLKQLTGQLAIERQTSEAGVIREDSTWESREAVAEEVTCEQEFNK